MFLRSILLPLLAVFTFTVHGQFQFHGTVAEVEDEANLLLGSVKAGDPLSGTFYFKGGTMEQGTAASQGTYLFRSGAGISLQIGGARFGSDQSKPEIRLELSNDEAQENGVVADRFLFRSYSNLPVNLLANVSHISWQLEDESASALNSRLLPSQGLDLSAWDSIHGLVITGSAFNDERRGYRIRAHVSSISLGR